MQEVTIDLSGGKTATGYMANLGPVNLVFANTDKAMIGCGAFDVDIFDKFDYPAAKIKGLSGRITSVDDLLEGEVVAVNKTAGSIGVKEGMSGREVLEVV